MTTEKIAQLNDEFRKTGVGGKIVMTAAIAAAYVGDDLVRLTNAVRDYTAFTEEHDPHGEHDMGVLEFDGKTVWFKIDYYDLDLCMASTDPADPAVTKRVLTLMLAEEY